MRESSPEPDRLSLALALALMVASFVVSYAHVHDSIVDWGQADPYAYVIAAMPEIVVMIGMRRFLKGSATPMVWLAFGLAGAFTLAGNLAQSTASLAGWAAGGAPAVFTVLSVALAGVHGRPATEAAQAAVTVELAAEATRPPIVTPVAATRPLVAVSAAGSSNGRVDVSAKVPTSAELAETVRAEWARRRATANPMADAEIAAKLSISTEAARSRRRGWDGSK